MTPEQLAALQATNAVKNTSLVLVKQFLFPQLPPLGLSPSGAFVEATGLMHGQGSGPGGTYTEDEIKSMGVPADSQLYLQYTIAGHDDANGPMLFDAADDVRIFQAYRGDNAVTPDPTFWYIDRVRKFFAENFQAPVSVADNAMLSMPTVRQAVEDVLTATVGGGPKTPVTIPGKTTDAAETVIGIQYHGPASQQAIDIMASVLGMPARAMGHVVLEPAETLYLARVKDQATAAAIIGKLKASPNGNLFDLADYEPSDDHQAEAIRAAGAIPMLTA